MAAATITITITITITGMAVIGMDEPAAGAAAKLAAWFSPGYPVGAFAYSHGLEWAVAAGDVRDRETATGWIAAVLAQGAGRSDAILMAAAWRAPEEEEPAVLAAALQPSAERRLEASGQGAAFAAVTAEVWPAPGLSVAPAPYPVAAGRAAAGHGIPLREALALYLQAFAANLVSAAVRLIPLGQTDGQRALAALVPLCARIAAEADTAGLDALGSCAIRADLASMRHETQDVRLFRS